jgi:hypothetical protein
MPKPPPLPPWKKKPQDNPFAKEHAKPKAMQLEVLDEEGESIADSNWSHLSEGYKQKRRMFVLEYIKDFNGANAVRRMGLICKQPKSRGSELLADGYTQYLLDVIVRDTEEKLLITRNQVVAGLVREANYFGFDGSAACRIMALKILGKHLGMEETPKVTENELIGGGVLRIPLASSTKEWESVATTAQDKLKKDVRK